VLESALSIGASSARVALAPSSSSYPDEESKMPTRFALGSHSEMYGYLDDQILDLTRVQESIVLNNLGRARILRIPRNSPRPQALMALALRHENQYYGAMWIAFDEPHMFSEEEIRFQTTLAGQAALAAANSYLFVNAEAGRQQLAAILASTPDPVLVIDQQGRLILSNPAAWQVLGLGVEWDEGQPIERIITNDDLLSLVIGSQDDVQSTEVKLSDGRVYYATATTVMTDRQRMGRVCVLRDVTYFKELDTLKSDFVATVSHDLRSPLTLMRGYATMLEMVGELNEQQLSYVRKIVGSVENMSQLVNNLLDLGRIEAGIDLQLELIAIQDVVEGVLGSFQLEATQRKVKLTKNLPDQSFPLIEADQALIQQALHNLVENAIKYTNPGGQVTVRLFTQEKHIVIEVSDSGIGVAPVDQPRLFEKFYRGAQQGEKPQRGSGLGLAIVKSIAERHGGRVWFDSRLGKGSTFYFSIPLRQG
jgi:PAS domain S-box-containing protein